jgi:hypothetical protein
MTAPSGSNEAAGRSIPPDVFATQCPGKLQCPGAITLAGLCDTATKAERQP